MSMFLSAGNVLINPAMLSYAIVETDSEGLHLRLRFSEPEGTKSDELRLTGLEARSVLRWLRSHTDFLDSGGSSTRRDRSVNSSTPHLANQPKHVTLHAPAPASSMS